MARRNRDTGGRGGLLSPRHCARLNENSPRMRRRGGRTEGRKEGRSPAAAASWLEAGLCTREREVKLSVDEVFREDFTSPGYMDAHAHTPKSRARRAGKRKDRILIYTPCRCVASALATTPAVRARRNALSRLSPLTIHHTRVISATCHCHCDVEHHTRPHHTHNHTATAPLEYNSAFVLLLPATAHRSLDHNSALLYS